MWVVVLYIVSQNLEGYVLTPLVQRKAFGETAGLVALGVSLATVATLVWLGMQGALGGGFPVMVVLAPLAAVQYAFWRSRRPERTWAWDVASRGWSSTPRRCAWRTPASASRSPSTS